MENKFLKSINIAFSEEPRDLLKKYFHQYALLDFVSILLQSVLLYFREVRKCFFLKVFLYHPLKMGSSAAAGL